MASLLERIPQNHMSQWSLPLRVLLLSLVAELELFQRLKPIVLFSPTPLLSIESLYFSGGGLLKRGHLA